MFFLIMNYPHKIKIDHVDSVIEREPLFPYHFKGGAVTENWQVATLLQNSSGPGKIGLSNQGILWSDAKVFETHGERVGNELMYNMSKKALEMIKGTAFSTPIKLLDRILPDIYEYGKKVTGNPELRKTFALNSLVSIDNAAWLLYAQQNQFYNFDDIIPGRYKPGLSFRHNKVASIPAFPVGTDIKKIKEAADQGYFIMKLKTGSAGDQQKMLENDNAYLAAVHNAIGHYQNSYTKSGKVLYYIDPNGRYEKKETLQRFLDHAEKIGALDQIALIEEPFDEKNETYVGDLGVTIAADESAHTVEDAANRIEQGYTAIVVKSIAKTLSMTMKIIELAHKKQTPCFCADLTVNPILVDWNKSIAARLAPIPGLEIGLLEANGHQYYQNWNKMMTYHPTPEADWVQVKDGIFHTGASFYSESGGIFQPSGHYEQLFS